MTGSRIILNRKHIINLALGWWFLFVVLSFADFNFLGILNCTGFLALVIIPGGLTLLSWRIHLHSFWGFIGLAVGVSLLELMAVGLIANALLLALHVPSPLVKEMILFVATNLVLILAGIFWRRSEWFALRLDHKFLIWSNRRDALMSLFPAGFVVMSVLGAIRLNNGGDGIVTALMLLGVAGYLLYLSRRENQIGHNVLPTALFLIALALLLMTSLRGWYITGHDVQKEFHIFQLVKNYNNWSITSIPDAYNACLSITILPTIFARVLQIPDPYIYKVLYQIIFALVPPLLYLTFKKYLTRLLAFLSAVYFITFPSFYTDMPMLNRQEIAFLYLALSSYVIFAMQGSLRVRRWLYVLIVMGVVFSHYSTTYTLIATLFFLFFAREVLNYVIPHFSRVKKFKYSAIDMFGSVGVFAKKHFSVSMLIAIVGLSFFWSNIYTHTSAGSIERVAKEMILALKSNVKNEMRSGNTSLSLFFGKKIDPVEEFNHFQTTQVSRVRYNAETFFYSDQNYKKYPTEIITNAKYPLTTLGQAMARLGIDVTALNFAFRQITAQIVQIFIAVGFLYTLYDRRFFKKSLDTDFVLLAMGSLMLVASQVVLPVLSVEYGVFRAFHQALMFLAVFVVVGNLAFLKTLAPPRRLRAVSYMAILFFISSTGVLTYLWGGYTPLLHLSNSAPYYDMYYKTYAEEEALQWAQKNISRQADYKMDFNYQFEGHTARFALSDARSINRMGWDNDILPALVRRRSYVFLGDSNINRQRSTIFYNGDNLVYTYPIRFLDDNKDLIYSNSGARIYR